MTEAAATFGDGAFARTRGLSRLWWIFTFAVLSAVTVLPLFIPVLLPLADFPNNMARMYVLGNLDTNADLQRFYLDVTAAQPNMAMEMFVLPLQKLMGLEAASKFFVGIAMLSLVAGTCLLHRVLHKRLSPWPMLAFPLVFNRLLVWGFASYLFSVGLALAASALWIATRERSLALRVALSTAAATLLYLSHLYGLGVYVIIVAGYELSRYYKERHFPTLLRHGAVGILTMLPAAALFLFVSPTSQATGDPAIWGSLHRRLEAPVTVIYASDWRVDLACFTVVAAGVVLWLIRRKIRFETTMIGSLLLLCILALAMPDKLLSSYAADHRLPIAIALCIIAAMDIQNVAEWRRAWPLMVAVVVHVVRVAFIGHMWTKADEVYQADLKVIEQIPYGARVLPAVTNAENRLPAIPEFEIASMAVIKRNAFVPSLFAYPRNAGQTVAFTPEMQKIVDQTAGGILYSGALKDLRNPEYARVHGPYRADLLPLYDVALIAGLEDLPPHARPPAHLPVIAKSPTLTLIDLHPERR